MVLNAAACLIVRKHKFDSISSTIRERDVLHWLRFNSESMYKLCMLVYNCLHDVAPVYLSTMCQPVSKNIGRRSLRSAARGCLAVPITRTVHCVPCSFTVVGLSTRNSLPARPVINPNIPSTANSRPFFSSERMLYHHARDCYFSVRAGEHNCTIQAYIQ